ncbi:MAG: tRNA (adenosine(37)-N6)-threonylcarbamoyltransferase complex transferase subunit TsaD [Bdellovibrionales bacterium]|nr:tRNA (adenosine(37)-N6)-threonylcarbamoyltransferase complex transferase subunit TsaD [Bdellovibrionales bacterium]
MSLILSIETSCDDTSVALVKDHGQVIGLMTANQDDVHKSFGGVVPEIAGRSHSVTLLPLIDKLLTTHKVDWSEVTGIAVTNRPGLVGSLMVGVVTAKTLALSKNIPFIGVNHLEGHLVAPFLMDDSYKPPADLKPPYVALAVSGGHTQLYCVKNIGEYELMGYTVDDAAGEAFDKFAKMLRLGFPGGVYVDKLAQKGDSKAYTFPRSMIKKGLNFSFSGLKAAAQRQIEQMPQDQLEAQKANLCASYQQAIVDVLIAKLNTAVELANVKRAVITGGVSANSQLRLQAEEWAQKNNITLAIPPIRYCTDNAAMIGYLGLQKLEANITSDQSLSPSPNIYPDDFKNFEGVTP